MIKRIWPSHLGGQIVILLRDDVLKFSGLGLHSRKGESINGNSLVDPPGFHVWIKPGENDVSIYILVEEVVNIAVQIPERSWKKPRETIFQSDRVYPLCLLGHYSNDIPIFIASNLPSTVDMAEEWGCQRDGKGIAWRFVLEAHFKNCSWWC